MIERGNGRNKFQPLPIFSSIETARAITSSCYHFASHPFRPILFQQTGIVLRAEQHADDEIMYDQDPKTAAARTGHA